MTTNTTTPDTVRCTLHAGDGAPIAVDVRSLPGDHLRPVVLVLHGLKGFKDWGFFPYVCDALARRGALVVSFNFSLNGVRSAVDEFDDLDGFARNTISRELGETGLLLRAIADGSLAAQAPALHNRNGDIFLLGHSRGGGLALLAARDFPDLVTATATWNAVATYDRFTARQKQEWRSRGVLESVNARTKQKMGMNVSYLDDIEQNAARLTPATAAAGLRSPLLIVHGEQDMTVPVREAQRLAEAQPAAQLDLIPQAGHTFHVVHPFAGTTPQLERALGTTAVFFGL